MKVIFKYLKPFVVVLILSIALLFGQALCDLSLPNLMSDIVNVGIQKNGIDDQAPKAISENGFTLIKLFTDDEGREVLDNNYKLIEPGTSEASDYEKDYPKIKDEAIYVLNASKEDMDNVGDAYGRSAFAFMTFMKNYAAEHGQTTADTSGDMSEGFGDVDMTELYKALPMLKMLPAETFADSIDTSLTADATFTDQVGVTFTNLFYKELGTDMTKIERSYIINKGLIMLLVAFAGVLASVGVGFFASRIGSGISRKMRRDVFAKIESFSSNEFDKFSTSSLITRTTNDIMQVQMLIIMGLRIMCYAPIMGIGGVIMAVGKSVSLSWIIAAAVLVLMGLIMVIFAVAMPKFKMMQKLIDKINLISRENLSGMMVIRAFGTQKHEEDRFDKANIEVSGTNRFVQRTMSFMMPAMMLIMNAVTLVVVWVGGHAIAESTMQVGDMMAFLQYSMQIIMSFLMIAMMFIMVPRASVSAVRIKEVLDTEVEIKDPVNARNSGEKIKGVIDFKDVSFKYHGAEDEVLHNLSFTANPGQTTAFIGSTGSGKSTVINLIPRFYDVTEGSIEIDGIDIRDMNQKELRDQIGFVPQKGVLFSGDIASNIRYGKEDASEQEIYDAIEIAQAKDFVSETVDKIATPIAQGGGNVSGGQKQRLAIARALIKKAPIYIFDDSFSALDFKTDAALRRALVPYTEKSTVIIVAQRVSTIMNAEQIIVLDEGRIVGKGTHQELLKSCETYREIAESQLSKEEL